MDHPMADSWADSMAVHWDCLRAARKALHSAYSKVGHWACCLVERTDGELVDRTAHHLAVLRVASLVDHLAGYWDKTTADNWAGHLVERSVVRLVVRLDIKTADH